MSKASKTSFDYRTFILPFLTVLLGAVFIYYAVQFPEDNMVADYLSYSKIYKLLMQHIYIVIISGIAAIATAVPLGIITTRQVFKRYSNLIVNIVNIGQTVPSLAVLALFVGILGIGFKPAVFALWIYSLLPILNNTMAGILAVDKSVLEAAKGMGMPPLTILRKIEMPLSYSVIMAGIRTAVTINIGSATLAAFVGGGGLGELIITGSKLNRWQIYVLGALLSALLAILVDHLLGIFEAQLAKYKR